MKLLDIPLSQAFGFCFHQSSYVGCLIGAVVVSVIAALLFRRIYQKTQDAIWGILGLAVPIIVLACALLIRPCSVAANTSPEEAQRGVFIG